MKYKVSQRRITLLIVLFPLAVLFIYGLMSYLFISYIQQNDISKEVERYEKFFLESQRTALENKVTSLIHYIKYYDQKLTEKTKTDIKNFVEVNADIADNLYWAHKGKGAILTALKNIKLKDQTGNLFIMDTRGYVHQHFDKTLEHRVILHTKDTEGREFVKDFNSVIKYEGAGYVLYSWYKPDNSRDMMYDKLSYIKKIAYSNWYIGAGFYLEDLKNMVKDDILEYIASNAVFDYGFFYILDSHKNIVFCPEDKVSSKLTQYIENGFFTDDNTIYHSRYIKKYDWHIVGVKDLGNRDIDSEKMQHQKGVEMHNVKTDLMLLGVALFASMLLSLYLSYIIYRQFKSYEEQINDSHDKMMFRTKQALIGELFSMIAHQWRQPINKIASIVALMRAELHNDKITKKELDGNCEEIEESIEYMSETIEDFRTFYKPTSAVKIVNLKELIRKSVTFLNNSIEKKRIKVIQKLAEDIEIKLYRNEFLQVMLNLLKNAIDATDIGGVITIRLYRHGKRVIISVENSGEPISEEVMRKIFQPYFTTKKDSMGLGLYMTKIIVEKHMKGEILIERLPQGTKFLIIL